MGLFMSIDNWRKPSPEPARRGFDQISPGTSAGYLAYPDFHSAALWYALFGRPETVLPPPPDFGGEDENQPEPQDQDQDQDQSEKGEENDFEEDTSETDGSGDDSDNGDLGDLEEEAEPDDSEREGEDNKDDEDGPGGNQNGENVNSEEEFEPELDSGGETEIETTPEPIEAAEYELEDLPDPPKVMAGFWTSTDDEGRFTVNREFKSWFDFVSSAADENLYAWQKTGKKASHVKGNQSGKRKIEGWYGTDSFDEAVDMALRSGWPEGRKLLTDMLITATAQPKVHETWMFEVAGAFPCVPVYCAGDPACMILDPESEQKSARPIVRIDYANGAAWTVGVDALMLRGAAVLSFANSLEERGFSTELRIVNASMGSGWTYLSKDKIIRYSITYKSAGEVLDLDRAAFALAHPSTFRRLAFAIYEQHSEIEDEFCHGYGYSMHQPNDPTSGQPGGAIFVNGAQAGETVETARRAVEIAAEAAGFAPDRFNQAA